MTATADDAKVRVMSHRVPSTATTLGCAARAGKHDAKIVRTPPTRSVRDQDLAANENHLIMVIILQVFPISATLHSPPLQVIHRHL